MNQAFADLIKGRIAAAVASAASVSNVDHELLKGALREAFVRDLLRPVLPPRLGIGHGIIASAYGQQSTEQDVVIFDGNAIPSVLLDGLNGLIPIEAALFSIEVKSRLSNRLLRETHDKAVLLQRIMHLPNPSGQAPEHVIPCLFAWGSDLRSDGENELSRYQAIHSNDPPAVRSICVVGRGYWFFTNEWNSIAADAEYSEVKAFVAGLFDTYARVASTRVTVGLRQYLRP